MADAKTTRVTTGKVLFSYVHVFEPTSIEEGGTLKYNTQIIFSKKDKKTLSILQAGIKAAEDGYAAKNGGKLPKKWKTPIRDGDDEKEGIEEYENCYFLALNSQRKPGVFDKNYQKILDPEEFYSGCFGLACINFYAFDVAGNKGIAAGLESIMKLSDGEPLGGSGGNPQSDFANASEYMDDDEDDLD